MTRLDRLEALAALATRMRAAQRQVAVRRRDRRARGEATRLEAELDTALAELHVEAAPRG